MDSIFTPTRTIQAVMRITSGATVIALFLLFFCLSFQFCTAIDTIISTQFIKDPETIVSNGGAFKLGFFSPGGSTNRYVGIWYGKASLSTIIWVANRDRPLNDTSGVLKIAEDGNLQVMNGEKRTFWSSNVSNAALNTTVRLLDTGNLVLQENSRGSIIWDSFQHPSHTLLQNMKLSINKNTGEKQVQTSWKTPSDPSLGSFTVGIDPSNVPQVFIWNGSHPCWRTGPWNGQIFIGVPYMKSVVGNRFRVVDDQEGTIYATFTFSSASMSLYYILTPEGTLEEIVREKDNWKVTWQNQNTECEVYGKCGAFGICNPKNSPICSCLRGYEPENREEWSRGNWSGGCARKTPLQCDRIKSSGEEGKTDGFLRLTRVKVPDSAVGSPVSEGECREECLKNCSCIAYSYYTGIGCMSWSGKLIDIQKFPRSAAVLYVRVAHSELGESRDMKVIVTVAVIIGIVTVICIYFFWRWMAKQRARAREEKLEEVSLFERGNIYPKSSEANMLGNRAKQVKLEELLLIDFEKLVTATDNFNEANKLGQGGFGPVYWGKLAGGQEIAVKKLSRASAQGLAEFMNEVMVISNVQHRNLVRLLGCCTDGNEKMLVYEYMPNKSLDAFLFDPVKRESLNWRRRFSIIEGIGRGLLYLHRDSRLRIIHRDLKAGNILLDKDLNPKISDFGMARIFGGTEDQANTMRVVGTYGYMSPEYAMRGVFSEKSDVFSFGVLLLEIVSGLRNNSFCHDDQSWSLLGYAWKLWKEGKMEALIDDSIAEACFEGEILRCIHVGLLCVQEIAKDRPSISTVLGMLCSEIAHLPPPKQPAFAEIQTGTDTESSLLSQNNCSVNQVTVTIVQPR